MENACFRKTKMNKIHRKNAIELGNGHGHMAFVGLCMTESNGESFEIQNRVITFGKWKIGLIFIFSKKKISAARVGLIKFNVILCLAMASSNWCFFYCRSTWSCICAALTHTLTDKHWSSPYDGIDCSMLLRIYYGCTLYDRGLLLYIYVQISCYWTILKSMPELKVWRVFIEHTHSSTHPHRQRVPHSVRQHRLLRFWWF